jgi:hypothetical protein
MAVSAMLHSAQHKLTKALKTDSDAEDCPPIILCDRCYICANWRTVVICERSGQWMEEGHCDSEWIGLGADELERRRYKRSSWTTRTAGIRHPISQLPHQCHRTS